MKGFSGFKSSPAKQKDFNKTGSKASTTPGYSSTKAAKANMATGGDPKLEKLKAKRIANTKAGKIIKFAEGSNIIADKGPIDPWSSEVKKTVKKGTKVAKKVVKKGIDVVKKKASRLIPGVGTLISAADLLTSKTATATKPVDHGGGTRKSEGEQIKNLLTKHKLKGGNN